MTTQLQADKAVLQPYTVGEVGRGGEGRLKWVGAARAKRAYSRAATQTQ